MGQSGAIRGVALVRQLLVWSRPNAVAMMAKTLQYRK